MPANRLALWAIRRSLRSSAVEKVAIVVAVVKLSFIKKSVAKKSADCSTEEVTDFDLLKL